MSTLRALLLLGAAAQAGCLADPDPQTCGESTADGPACAPEAGLPDRGQPTDLAVDPDVEVDLGPDPVDAVPDGPPADAGEMTPDRECEPGTDRPCGTDEGTCEAGRAYCNADGRYEACFGAVGPTDERCNGFDDDCDGTTDENGSTNEPCVCIDGATQPCGRSIGACIPGEQTCVDGAWAECVGAVDGGEEVCDGIDNDCDGETDDVPAVVERRPCTVGVGRCAAAGVLTCVGDLNGQPVCDARPGEPAPESCNREDDDCDGTTDEAVEPQVEHLVAGDFPNRFPSSMAAFGDGHAVAWIDGSAVMWGRANGAVWTVAPRMIGPYRGGGSGASRVAMAADADGIVLAVSSFDEAAGAVRVYALSPAGDVETVHEVHDRRSPSIDIAARDGFGFAVAFEDEDPATGTGSIYVDVFADGGEGRSARFEVRAGGLVDLAYPAVTWAGASPALAARRTDPAGAAGMQVSVFEGADGVPRTWDVSSENLPFNADLHWLPGHERLALAWDEDDPRTAGRRIGRVAFMDLDGRITQRVELPGAGSTTFPTLMPEPGGGEPTHTIGVARVHTNDALPTVSMGWLTYDDARWTAAPGSIPLFARQGETTGISGAFADRYGVFFMWDGGGRSVRLGTIAGCPARR